MRVYGALAKGNLWLFMDIYPWMWFALEYGINSDGSLNADRLKSHVGERNAGSLQEQSKTAVQELPYAKKWLGRLSGRIAADPVYGVACEYFKQPPIWAGPDGGYGAHQASAYQAHRYVRQHVKGYDAGYRMSASGYWPKFSEAYYVIEEERRELSRIAADGAALGRLEKVAVFRATPQMRKTYALFIEEHSEAAPRQRLAKQHAELQTIAEQEQLNILQPLIYEDAKLIETMDLNHRISRLAPWATPRYRVIYSASPNTADSSLQTTFDPPTSVWNAVAGERLSLPNPIDRMEYVALIADDFNRLMDSRRTYMEAELRKIRAWLNA